MKPLLLLSLLLASCANRSANPKVRIAIAGTGLQIYSMPFTLAQTLGHYREEGVEVELEHLPSLPKSLQALIGGSVDVAGLAYLQNIQIAAEGQHIRSFFLTTRRAGHMLIVSPAATSRIQRAEDLKGALIGVVSPGSVTHLFTNFYLAQHGLQPSDFRTASIGLGASALAAVESGRVDAASISGGDHLHLLRRHPNLRILVDASTPQGMQDIYGADTYAGGTLSAKQEWLDRNPDAARRLSRALRRTLTWISTHQPAEIRDKLPDHLRTQDPSLDLEIIRWGLASFTSDGAMPNGAPEIVKRFLDATIENVRNAKIDLNATWTNDFLPAAK